MLQTDDLESAIRQELARVGACTLDPPSASLSCSFGLSRLFGLSCLCG